MTHFKSGFSALLHAIIALALFICVSDTAAQETKSSFDQISPVLLGKETFEQMKTRDQQGKEAIMGRQMKLLAERYNLESKPHANVKMSRGKPVQVGPAAKLAEGTAWAQLADMPPNEIRDKGVFPKGFLPLP